MTEKKRLGRSKPVVTTSGELSFNALTISSFTSLVAVAVNAPTTGLAFSPDINSAIFK